MLRINLSLKKCQLSHIKTCKRSRERTTLLHNGLSADLISKGSNPALLPSKRRDKDRHSLMHAAKMPHLLPYKVNVASLSHFTFLLAMGAVITAVFSAAVVVVVLIAVAALPAAFPLTPLASRFPATRRRDDKY